MPPGKKHNKHHSDEDCRSKQDGCGEEHKETECCCKCCCHCCCSDKDEKRDWNYWRKHGWYYDCQYGWRRHCPPYWEHPHHAPYWHEGDSMTEHRSSLSSASPRFLEADSETGHRSPLSSASPRFLEADNETEHRSSGWQLGNLPEAPQSRSFDRPSSTPPYLHGEFADTRPTSNHRSHSSAGPYLNSELAGTRSTGSHRSRTQQSIPTGPYLNGELAGLTNARPTSGQPHLNWPDSHIQRPLLTNENQASSPQLQWNLGNAADTHSSSQPHWNLGNLD